MVGYGPYWLFRRQFSARFIILAAGILRGLQGMVSILPQSRRCGTTANCLDYRPLR